MSPLIPADQTYLLLGVLCLIAGFGFWLDTTKLGKNISGVAGILAVSMLLSNIGIVPKSAPVYGVVWLYLVPLAIPMMLLKADLRRIISETKSMLGAFVFGAIGTTIGAILGYLILPLGPEGHKLAGVFSATYIGGSMNMAAVTQSVELSPSLAAASVAADNVLGVLYLSFLAIVPSTLFFQKLFQKRLPTDTASMENARKDEDSPGASSINLMHIAVALGLSFVICAVGTALANMLGLGSYGIMFITAITILIANLFPKQLKPLTGDYEIGLLFMYLFFAAVGFSADIAAMLENAIVVVVYVALIVVVHAAVIFAGSRFSGVSLMETIIASNACAAGPASAAALAAGKNRADLVAPAILLGVFGYAVANFVGVTLALWLGA